MRRASLVLLQVVLLCLGALVFLTPYRGAAANRITVFRRDPDLETSAFHSTTRAAFGNDGGHSPRFPGERVISIAYDKEQPPPVINETLVAAAEPYVHAILDRDDSTFQRLQCLSVTGSRYGYLHVNGTSNPGHNHPIRYFFALNLHQNVNILPRLLGAILEAMVFLGPKSCAISIVSSPSTDGTYEILNTLKPAVEVLGAKFYLAQSTIDLDNAEDFPALHNLALAPLTTHSSLFSVHNTTAIYLNSVVICPDDILELLHQRHIQSADMTCAMDWAYVDSRPTFASHMTARDILGHAFFDPPPFGAWEQAWGLFTNNPGSNARYAAGLPFQVFSCWNGAAAFTARPILEKQVSFRGPYDGECFDGADKLFCKDLWMQNYRRIAVVPSVHVAYSDEVGTRIKSGKGYVGQYVEREPSAPQELEREVQWLDRPPELVKCSPKGQMQAWMLWDQGLSRHLFD